MSCRPRHNLVKTQRVIKYNFHRLVVNVAITLMNEFNTAPVAAFLPTVNGVDMSFLPNGGLRSYPLEDDSSSSADNTSDTGDDSSDDNTSDSSGNDDNQPNEAPITKKTRQVHPRRPMNDSACWHYFLAPEARAELLRDPDGKLANQFRKAFRLPYLSFKTKIFDFAVKTWWPDLTSILSEPTNL